MPVSPARISQILWSYVPPLALQSAVQNNVFASLEKSPKTISELAEDTGASHRGLHAIADLLVGLELLTKDDQDRYALTEESSTFLVPGKPAYQGGMCRHISEQLIPNFLHLPEVVRSGQPVVRVDEAADGAAFFEELVSDIFPLSYNASRALAHGLPQLEAESGARVLDVATGSGAWGIGLAQGRPNVQVTGVDWPNVLEVTRRTVARFGLESQFDYIAGNIREVDLGTGYQVATLGHILHSEGGRESQNLLKRVFAALAPAGTVVISEFLVNQDRRGPLGGLIFAVNMLVNTSEGTTFSFEEIASWLTDAGFVNPRLLEAPAPSPLILADKPA